MSKSLPIVFMSILIVSCSSLQNFLNEAVKETSRKAVEYTEKYSVNAYATENGLSLTEYSNNISTYYTNNNKNAARELKRKYPALHLEFKKQFDIVNLASDTFKKKPQEYYTKFKDWYNAL